MKRGPLKQRLYEIQVWWTCFTWWPWRVCMCCGNRFWCGFAWGGIVDHCSRGCANAELDFLDLTRSVPARSTDASEAAD